MQSDFDGFQGSVLLLCAPSSLHPNPMASLLSTLTLPQMSLCPQCSFPKSHLVPSPNLSNLNSRKESWPPCLFSWCLYLALLLIPYSIDYLFSILHILLIYLLFIVCLPLIKSNLWLLLSKVISVMAKSMLTGALQTCTQCLGCSLMTCGLRRVQYCLHLL